MVFILSLQEKEGDSSLVNLIDDWDVLAEYAGEKLGFYQRIGNDGPIEVRVQTGRIGYNKEFKTGNDLWLLKILDFCEKHSFIRISEYMRDEDFSK